MEQLVYTVLSHGPDVALLPELWDVVLCDVTALRSYYVISNHRAWSFPANIARAVLGTHLIQSLSSG